MGQQGAGRRVHGVCVVLLVLCAHGVAASDRIQATAMNQRLTPWALKALELVLKRRNNGASPFLHSTPSPPTTNATPRLAAVARAPITDQQLQSCKAVIQNFSPGGACPKSDVRSGCQCSEEGCDDDDKSCVPCVEVLNEIAGRLKGEDAEKANALAMECVPGKNWCIPGNPEPCGWINRLRVFVWFVASDLEMVLEAQASRQSLRDTLGHNPSRAEQLKGNPGDLGLSGVLLAYLVASTFAFTDLAGPASDDWGNQLTGLVPGAFFMVANIVRASLYFTRSPPTPEVLRYFELHFDLMVVLFALVVVFELPPLLLLLFALGHAAVQLLLSRELLSLLQDHSSHSDTPQQTTAEESDWQFPEPQHVLHLSRDQDGHSTLIHSPGYGDEEFPYPSESDWHKDPEVSGQEYAELKGSPYYSWVYYRNGVFFVKDESQQ